MVELRSAFEKNGAVRLRGLINEDLSSWEDATKGFFDLGKPGHRITCCPKVASLTDGIARTTSFINLVGHGWQCVRAIAFNKLPKMNWGLGWHQDRTIAVARREILSDFQAWSKKDGIPHVEPPFDIIERMVTLRLHLDPVNDVSAPLLCARGSHRLGKVAESAIQKLVSSSAIDTCYADAGDGWFYSTPILHASKRSQSSSSRRVLHLDFSRDALPPPLEWAGLR